MHNREEVYTTAYKGTDYCRFSPGYTYTDQEIQEIMAFMAVSYTHLDVYKRQEQIKEYLAGNLCRCSGFVSQTTSILKFLKYKKAQEDA